MADLIPKTHDAFMDEALALAARGGRWVSPNPNVGAIVVRDGQVVGRGWHQRYGDWHAEVNALREAGEAARGATLYCTLEPCNHWGNTGPCSQAVILAGIRTVVLGARDPNPVAAGGIEALRNAGIEVITDVREQACREINAPFFKRVRTGLPLVSLKWAMTLDGKIATATGHSKWITSPDARQAAHAIRAEHDAVLVGIGTVLADNPRLNCRWDSAPAPIRQPRRIVLDTAARTPPDSQLLDAGGGSAIIICGEGAEPIRIAALERRGATVITLPKLEDGRPLLIDAMRAAAKEGVQSVFVEGGGEVLGAFRDASLVDQIYAFIAPKVLGGRGARTAVGGAGADRLEQGIELRDVRHQTIGPDILVIGRAGPWEWLA